MFDIFRKNNEEIDIDENEIKNEDILYNGVSILKPKSYDEDSKKIAEMIKANNLVAFSLENMSREDGQRLIDYLSGATFVLGGTVIEITDKVFASVPQGVVVRNN